MTSNTNKKKRLVFVSAGKNSKVETWLDGRNYDVWVAFYEGVDRKISSKVDFFIEREGSKFQNIHALWLTHREALLQYESILLADDDIVISPAQLETLFAQRTHYSLSALQPSFLPHGKNSYKHTQHRFFSNLRYVNFIEMTFPVFASAELDKFLAEYDPQVISWGSDIWFCDFFLKKSGPKALAVSDAVAIFNPYDDWKKNLTSIEHIAPKEERRRNWEGFANGMSLPIEPPHSIQEERVPGLPIQSSKDHILSLISLALRKSRSFWANAR